MLCCVLFSSRSILCRARCITLQWCVVCTYVRWYGVKVSTECTNFAKPHQNWGSHEKRKKTVACQRPMCIVKFTSPIQNLHHLMYGASVIGWDSVWLASLYLFPLPLSPISPQPSPSPTPTPVSASHQHHYHTQHQPSPSLPPSSLSSSSSSPVSCSTLFVANLELHHTEDEVANLFGK